MTASPEASGSQGPDFSFDSALDHTGYTGKGDYDEYAEKTENELDAIGLDDLANNIVSKHGVDPARRDTDVFDLDSEDKDTHVTVEAMASTYGAHLARVNVARKGDEPSVRYTYRTISGQRGTTWSWEEGSDVVTGADFSISGNKTVTYVDDPSAPRGRRMVVKDAKHEYGENYDLKPDDVRALKMSLLRGFLDVQPRHPKALPVENPRAAEKAQARSDQEPSRRKRRALGFLGIRGS
jgi:hypothetical protein